MTQKGTVPVMVAAELNILLGSITWKQTNNVSVSLSDNTNSCYRIGPEGILCAFWETTLMKMVIGGGGVIFF